MNRSVTLSIVVLAVSLFVGSVLRAEAATTIVSPSSSVGQSAGDASTEVGYWAAWGEAASH
jgi:hypothetical protein